MYVLYQTQQAPLQTDWCSLGLTYYSDILKGKYRLCPNGSATANSAAIGVYASPNGQLGNIYTNQLGILTFLFIKSSIGSNPVTLEPPYIDAISSITPMTTTTYSFTIVDTNTGQDYTVLNSITW